MGLELEGLLGIRIVSFRLVLSGIVRGGVARQD